jgi:serine phosphatase RsbU (regulator of sigma subunit)
MMCCRSSSAFRFAFPLLFAVAMATSSLGVASSNTKQTDSLLTELSKTESDTQRIKTLNAYSADQINHDAVKAKAAADEAMAKARKLNYIPGLIYSHLCEGKLQYVVGDYDKARANCDSALALNAAGKYQEGLADTYNLLGDIARVSGNLPLSLDYLLKASAVFEKTGNKAGEGRSMIAIGNVYFSQHQYPQAALTFEKVLHIRESLGDSSGVADCCNNLGASYKHTSQFDMAFGYYNRALRIYQSTHNMGGVSFIYSNLSSCYMDMGKAAEALDYGLKGLHIDEEMQSKNDIAISCQNIAEAYQNLHQYDKALEYGMRSLTMCKELKDAEGIELGYGELSSIYAAKKDFEKAYANFVLYSQMKDSLFNSESSKQIAGMNAKYENGKKEQAILLLNKDKELSDSRDKKKNILIYAALAGLALMAGLVTLIFRSNKHKQRANRLLSMQKEEIARQKDMVEEKNKEVTDSIRYAKRIQEAILPGMDLVHSLASDSFVLFKPKDIVSGDFYWFEKSGPWLLFAVADCTGHGVPGAFMSIVGSNLLNQCVNEKGMTNPALILDDLNIGLSRTLHQNYSESGVKDGMDIALCAVNTNTLQMAYAGAYNPLWIVSVGAMQELKADKFPVGAFIGEELKKFHATEVQLKKGDCLYLFSDGYADQFGGTKGKKFKYKPLQELVLSMAGMPMQEQEYKLQSTLETWKMGFEQTDDVCVIGIRV